MSKYQSKPPHRNILISFSIRENSRYEAGAPMQMMKQLNNGKLALSDLEIGDEDIAVLIRLFNTKKVTSLD